MRDIINKPNVYILGAGGFGRELEVWLSKSDNFNRKFNIKGYLDDKLDALHGYPSEFKILGAISKFKFKVEDFVLLAISEPEYKRKIVEMLNGKVRFLSFISENAIIGKYIQIGEGTIIAPNVIITTNIRIGNFCTINLGSHLGHDTIVSDYTSIMTHVNIGGGVVIEESVYIGSNVTIYPEKKIGHHSKLSAGCSVISGVEPGSLLITNPAKNISKVFRKK